jgi:hypothetical protein
VGLGEGSKIMETIVFHNLKNLIGESRKAKLTDCNKFQLYSNYGKNKRGVASNNFNLIFSKDFYLFFKALVF